MLCAHMDEVGLIITDINDSGLLKFKTVGGIDPRVLLSEIVRIGKDNIYGVMEQKPYTCRNQRKEKPIKVKDLYIDIGVEDGKEAEKLIKIGDYAILIVAIMNSVIIV